MNVERLLVKSLRLLLETSHDYTINIIDANKGVGGSIRLFTNDNMQVAVKRAVESKCCLSEKLQALILLTDNITVLKVT